MDREQIKPLIEKYLNGTATTEESALVETWYNSYSEAQFPAPSHDTILAATGRIAGRLEIKAQKTTKHQLWPRIAAAAVIFIVAAAALIFYLNDRKQDTKPESIYANDIAPGKTGATLTLANGKKIRLADAAKGEIAKEAGITVSKSADGQLVYQATGNAGETNNINTLSTAKGETYILTLPDKSKVWLNAASSLTYSASLNERGLRRVKLEGEGYFEIAKDKAHPFIVESNGQQVEVLGTHFNVSAYEDEAEIKTTLLEGSVKVSSLRGTKQTQLLKPDQQSVLFNDKLKIQKINGEDAIAWKNGLFIFNDESLESIMQKVSRWYDVDVIYQGVNKNELYYGSVSRYDNISKILETLELTKGIHFKIEGRRLTVMK